ncbi:peptide MFS transporter [Shewanella sp. 1_MG-2023]|uniref:peptide MFS transporter n=1 Tax=unclassified Shewanella TaxID=196818 RepID=UPI000C82DA47|nr:MULTISPECIES: peptide MFS transporter [unclassified Shewanella]MCC4832621.1 peptide MFS transporter [Shewanella sp. 10N.7]MDO6612515.1 peptide MFS transporter [Shewanella sp. 7_MG-2023]MDO6772444.1 peptide MFS transporter [Shewanella sp. 2_MG-2023]MDO6794558.1 peptide MFS transporter [Shewanella sp. 1_MG-2023]PMG75036.1 dipeptide/tripeptide permease [Shewanella sp. 10N.286.51.B7]
MSNAKPQGTMLGHPKGLFLLFTTELWERFSYYAMRAILVLYLVDKVQTEGGHGLGWTQGDAISLYGTFTGLVYLTPLIGGWLADAYLGQRKAIMIGGALMAAGQFILALPHSWIPGSETMVFYIGLGTLIIGNGLFKPNISTMVGDLYEEGDHRRDGAFTIFYMGINVGAFLSGIIVGSVVAAYDGNFQMGFLCAGIGMVLSLIIQFLFAQKLLGDIGRYPAAKLEKEKQQELGEVRKEPLTKIERDRIKVIMVMGLFTIIFWAGFEQAGGLMNLFTNDFTDRMIGGWEVPTTWFQSLNAMFIVIFAPVIASIWIRLGKNEPNSPVKFALGLVLLGIGFLFMIGAVLEMGGDADAKSSMWWLVGAYFFHTMGELCLSPIGLSMVTKLAPLRIASLMMGAWFLFVAIANKVGGIVGSFIGHGGEKEEQLANAMAIFAGIAITSAVSGIILYFLADKLVDWMHGAEGHNETEEEALAEEIAVTAEHEAIKPS